MSENISTLEVKILLHLITLSYLLFILFLRHSLFSLCAVHLKRLPIMPILGTLREQNFQHAFQQWQRRWDRCFAAQGDYFQEDVVQT